VPTTGTVTYDPTKAPYQYTYHWIPNAAWRGTCRVLYVAFNDGAGGPVWGGTFFFH
jgi:hypothetical protein